MVGSWYCEYIDLILCSLQLLGTRYIPTVSRYMVSRSSQVPPQVKEIELGLSHIIIGTREGQSF